MQQLELFRVTLNIVYVDSEDQLSTKPYVGYTVNASGKVEEWHLRRVLAGTRYGEVAHANAI